METPPRRKRIRDNQITSSAVSQVKLPLNLWKQNKNGMIMNLDMTSYILSFVSNDIELKRVCDVWNGMMTNLNISKVCKTYLFNIIHEEKLFHRLEMRIAGNVHRKSSFLYLLPGEQNLFLGKSHMRKCYDNGQKFKIAAIKWYEYLCEDWSFHDLTNISQMMFIGPSFSQIPKLISVHFSRVKILWLSAEQGKIANFHNSFSELFFGESLEIEELHLNGGFLSKRFLRLFLNIMPNLKKIYLRQCSLLEDTEVAANKWDFSDSPVWYKIYDHPDPKITIIFEDDISFKMCALYERWFTGDLENENLF